MEPIKLHVEYTLAEYLEATSALAKRQRRSVRPILWLYLAAVVVAGWYIITGGSFTNSSAAGSIYSRSFLLSLWPYGVVMIGFFVTIRVWRRRYVARIYRTRH